MDKLLENLEFQAIGTFIEKAHEGDEGKRIIRGYASTADLDRQGEIISLQALKGAEKDLLRNPAVFLNHEHNKLPVGKTISAVVDEKGLLVTVEFTKAKFADDLWALISEGVVNRFSIGGRVMEAEEKRDKSGNIFNEITKIELFEVSIVGIPANPEAKFVVSKSFSMAITEELKKREVGKDMSKEEKKVEKTEATIETTAENTTTVELEVKVEDVDVSEEVIEDPTSEEEVGEVAEEAIEEAAATEKVIEEKSEEVAEEKAEETPSLEESSEEVVEEKETSKEVELKKSTDEKILDALDLILQHLTKADSIEKVEEIKEVETTDEVEEETTEEAATEEVVEDSVEEKAEEVAAEETAEETTEEEVAEVEEATVEKSEEVSTEKVVKVEETQEVEKSKETPLETAVRKGEIIIADTPHGEEQKETQLSKAELKKLREIGWAKLAWGK